MGKFSIRMGHETRDYGRLVLWLLVAMGITLGACTKNDKTTVTLIGTEYYVDDILSVIPDTLQSRFFAEFGSIPNGVDGVVPPKIEGSYVMDPKQRVTSNVNYWPTSVVDANLYLRFYKQHNGIAVIDLNEESLTHTDTVFVCGSGTVFCAYFIEDKPYVISDSIQSYSMRIKRGVIMKGQTSIDGLVDFRYATVIMETEDGSGGLFPQYPNGSYFIYKDGDGLAASLDW